MYKNIVLAACLLIMMATLAQAQDVDSQIDDIKTALINSNFEGGLAQCKSLIEANMADTAQLALVYGYAGFSSEALGQKDEALNYYKNAVQFHVPQLDIYDKLINLSKKAKNDSIYEFALLEKTKAFPEYNQDNTKSLAYHYINTQQYKKVISTTDELLNWYPENVNYLYFRGIALQNLGQIEEGKTYYTEVLKLKPDHAGSNMSLGMLLYKDGSEIFANKKKEYEAIAKPDRVDYAEYNRGIEKGKSVYKEALPYLLKAYKSGSYPDLKQVLFNTYVRLEQKDKAEAYR